MLKNRTRLIALAVTVALSASWIASADTWRLDAEQPWKEISAQRRASFLLALANADSDKGTNSLAVGSIYFNQHSYEDALKQFNDFLDNNPDDPAAATALVNQGDCYYRLQYYEQAIESWMTLLKRFPEAPEVEEAMYRIADTRFGLGRFDSAAAAYEQLRNRYPEGSYVADAGFGLANCLYNQGNDEGAILAFNAFIQDYPDDPRVEDAELGVQSCYYRSGKDMEDYLETNPDSPMAADIYWNKGQDAFAAGNFAEAARAFERVTLDYPESESGPGALFYLAESYYRAEDRDQALAGYHNFMTTHPDHDLAELAHLRAATVLFKQERFVEAAQGYETLVDLFPVGEYAPLSTYNAAVCYQEIEDWHAAIGGYVRFMVDHPEHENAQGLWVQVASLYQEELGDYRQAVEAYEHAIESGDAPVAEMRYRQGECHEKDGKMEAALTAYEQSAASGTAADAFRVASLARLAEIAEERGDNRAAIKYWQSIVNAGGKPEWTQMAQERLGALQSVGLAGG